MDSVNYSMPYRSRGPAQGKGPPSTQQATERGYKCFLPKKLKPSASGRVALAVAVCGLFGKLLFDGQLWDVLRCSSEDSGVRQVLFLHMKWGCLLCLCGKCLLMWWKRLEIYLLPRSLLLDTVANV